MANQTEYLKAKEWEEKYGSQYFKWKFSGWQKSDQRTNKFLKNLHKPSVINKEGRLFLYPHQFETLQRVIYSYEHLGQKDSLVNLATGTGKTVVIASTIAWLICRYENSDEEFDAFLLLCPNTIVRDRLKADFKDKSVFKLFKLFPKGYENLMGNIKPMVVSPTSNSAEITTHNLFVANKHQFENTGGKSQDQLLKLKDYKKRIAIFNDEAHNTRAYEYSKTLTFLKRQQSDGVGYAPFRFDLTATPKRADGLRPESHEFYELSVLEAITGSYQKNPYINKDYEEYDQLVKQVKVIQTQPDYYKGHNLNDEKIFVSKIDGRKFSSKEIEDLSESDLTSNQIMMEPGPMKLQLKAAVDELSKKKNIADGRYKPLLYVITPSIAGAEEAKKVLVDDFRMNPLVVTGNPSNEEYSKAELRAQSTRVSDFNSPYDSVINVCMLREGWDEPQVSVICLLRTFKSYLYAHQVIGRGLRMIRNSETKQRYREPKVQTCTVIDHPALGLDWLWKDFGVNLSDIKAIDSDSKNEAPEPLDEQLLIRDHIMEELIPPSPVDTLNLDLDDTMAAFEQAFMYLDKMSFEWILTGGKVSSAKVSSSLDDEVIYKEVEYEEKDLWSSVDFDIKTDLCRRIMHSVKELGGLCAAINRDIDGFYQKAIANFGLYIFGDKAAITKGEQIKLFKLLHNIDDLDMILQYRFVSEALNIINKRRKSG